MTVAVRPRAAWAEWRSDGRAYTLGVEEEAMLLDPSDWSLAHRSDHVLESLPEFAERYATAETHRSALELATGVHENVDSAMSELLELRATLCRGLDPLGMSGASAGTHPFAVWNDTVVSSGQRYEFVYGSMRELARREPTFALHVHVGVPSPNAAIRLVNRMRGHLPLLLALSVNSPFWQGRDSGLASARTPLFQAFPRVGIPRRFRDYAEYVETVDLLIRCDGFPEPSYLWWDVRPQPRFGTVEVRIMDAQSTVADTAAIVALVQSLARLELEQGWISDRLLRLPEVLDENRFIAARDGMRADLIDPRVEARVPARELLAELVQACEPHARALGCLDALRGAEALGRRTGADRQLERARQPERLPGLVAALAGEYCS
ncbi:MAG: glutamate---cysteine ligase / carboxylate-amine ligase [Thermoleophilaceae bacterium]|nr:glutamate---cysteine ligase / carboxylate-amine ligase [Thermoleophilaceae bacterium]